MNSAMRDEHSTGVSNAADAPGKRLLMAAALRLTAQSRSLSSLGLRELAREAGLNPNTFYRHFQSLDELGLAIIQGIGVQLREPLRLLRREVAHRAVARGVIGPQLFGVDLGRGRRVCEETVQLFFAFVQANPEGFILGMRELHGASPVLRAALRELMDAFAQDMAEDILALGLLLHLDLATVRRLSSMVSRQLFQLSLDYLERSDERQAVEAQAQELIMALFAGASVLQAVDAVPVPVPVPDRQPRPEPLGPG